MKDFAERYDFELDEFQVRAASALARGESVLVAAPTGAGKTVVGEYAVWLALSHGGKAFYTTPLKALSNQKFNDLVSDHGPKNVGLLTGDNSINASARVVVMTTEVLRNMIYERSELLDGLRYVVLDEVHYLQDRYRGAVWEEVIIHLPIDVRIVSLSATVSNAEEFADWIQTLRGPTTVIIEENRPVELVNHYYVDGALYPMFTDGGDEPTPNPQIRKLDSVSRAPAHRRHSGGRGVAAARRYGSGAPGAANPRNRGRGRRTFDRNLPLRTDVAESLREANMLPAIYFIFSRKGCDAAVQQCMRERFSLTTDFEREQIREIAQRRCSYLDPADLDVLGYEVWMEALLAGVAAHHAGLIPAFKETVEELFQAGIVKIVFATETLSLGINMPARTVVIESLNKFTGERHEMLTAGQFTQLTGRAGRRGIDLVGHAVVPRQREIAFQQIAGLASTRTYPLVSSFQPSYNMATNLARNYTRKEAGHLLNSSFAQYHADKDVVVWERQVERNDAYLASYREKMVCDDGDFADYWRLVERTRAIQGSAQHSRSDRIKEQTRSFLASARPGQVFLVPSGRAAGPVVVWDAGRSRRGEPRLVALTPNRRLAHLSVGDFPEPPRVVANLTAMMKGARSRGKGNEDHDLRKRVAAALSALDLPMDSVTHPAADNEAEFEAHRQMVAHPCHECKDRDKHGQWAERASRLERENSGLLKRVRSRTQTLSRRFERILEILDDLGYLDDFTLTAKGSVLARIYNENDLLIAEVLSRGWLNELGREELAAIVSTFVFESRGPYEVAGDLPNAATKKVYGKIARLEQRLTRTEARAGLELTRGTEAGFAVSAFDWCNGKALEEVLDEESTPGDFIRSCKQTIDLLRQIREAAGESELAGRLADAAQQMNRGVIAYTGVTA